MRLLPGFVMVLVLMMASGAGAATFNVDSQADSPDATLGDGVCASKAGGCTLRAAVEEANASSVACTINVPAGTYTLTSPDEGANFGQTGVLLLGGDTTVSGEALRTTVVNGDGKNRIFEVGNKANVTISGLTLREAQVKGGDGAAILNRGNLSVSNVLFLENRAIGDPLVAKSGRGAALFNTNGGTASLNSVVALKNTSDGKGGAFFNDEASTSFIISGIADVEHLDEFIGSFSCERRFGETWIAKASVRVLHTAEAPNPLQAKPLQRIGKSDNISLQITRHF